ncbi:hypothetical protein DERF_012183 [Dermatophagoides farinae]|uniref:Uncharacterized protein n=1 Tax=Dermatophagoides farinae TaxID=6954 RepID=A0A922HS23_DERFA|nr:hypothetical protein DERF_012183 [Dermatophagoides farinae]
MEYGSGSWCKYYHIGIIVASYIFITFSQHYCSKSCIDSEVILFRNTPTTTVIYNNNKKNTI